jgi:hypothetical protein
VQVAPGKDKWDFCRALDFLRPMLGLAGAGLCRIFCSTHMLRVI